MIAACECPVYASGNITLDNYKHLKNMNLAGFALSKSFFAYKGDKAELFKSISEEIKNW
jgi:thiamine monophosphate synthase